MILRLTIALTTYCLVASAETPVLYPTDPALSPDGQVVAFSYSGDLWRVAVDGGTAKQLTTHPDRDGQPAFSPDGRSIAFVSDRSGTRQLYRIPADGGRPEQLTFHTAGYSLQDWSRDGETLLAIGARDHHWRRPNRLLTVSANERSAEQVVVDAYADYGRLSPDGNQVLLTREGIRWWRREYRGSQSGQIWLYDIAADEFELVLKEETPCRAPLWKPDGTGFYFVRVSNGTRNVWSYDLASRKEVELTEFSDDPVLFPAISRDGQTIVFRRGESLYRLSVNDRSVAEIDVQIDADTADRTVRRTLAEATGVTTSHDGLEIAFAAGGDIWVMDTELKEPIAVTNTPYEEREPLFVDGGNTLLFVREERGQVDVVAATRDETDRYWWQNDRFKFGSITTDATTEHRLRRSPDGKHIGYIRGRGELVIAELDGSNVHQITTGFDAPDYDFSPDGKWIAWSQEDDNFNDEVWIAPVDGSREPFNVSRHPDDDWSPRWSADGKILAFLGRRSADEIDVYYVYLTADEDEKTSRDRTLEKAIKKLNTARPAKTQPETKASKEKASESDSADAKGDKKTDDSKEKKDGESEAAAKPDLPAVEIDFDELPNRVRRISIADSDESSLFWFGDKKTLAFRAKVAGKSGTYSVEIPDRLTPKLLSSNTGTFARRLKDDKKVAWLSSSRPGTLSTAGKTESYSFRALQEFDESRRYQAAFDVAWRLMRDNWYDDRFNNKNWDAIRRKYSEAAAASPDLIALDDVVSMMLGELNASHLGFTPIAPRSTRSWRPETAHLGLRFDPSHQGPGLKVRDVIDDGPADKDGTRIQAGEIIVRIDGTAVDPAMDLTLVLNGRLDRDITLAVRGEDEEVRDVFVRPISYSAARRLLYPQFEEESRARVDELSKGRLGYLHIERMDQGSFLDFERELYNAGYGKDGLVLDVRENGGGFTTDHLLTSLTQPRHAVTVPRGGGPGYPHDRKVYASWSKPVVVLCNQNSFSNAEIFSHAIKTLKRGKLVGVPTSGSVISTGSAKVMDVGYLRQPFRGWFVGPTGQDMELNGAVPDHVVWPKPGELPAGIDRQLEKAVQVLQRDARRSKKRPQPPLIKASERPPSD